MPDSRQHYNKAPIVEAVIEVRYEAPASIASIRQAATRLEGKYGYSNRRDTIEFKTHFNLNSNRTQQEKRVVGLQLASKDQREILILNEHRFTYALLAPYSEWDDLFQKAKNAWNVCSSAWSSRITRIGVRFVNRIDVPISLLETESPKSLFNIYPFFSREYIR